MTDDVTLGRETLATVVTLEPLLARVRHHVYVQITLTHEPLPALLTLIMPPSVDKRVAP